MKSVAMIAIHGQRVIIYPGSVIQRPDPGPFFSLKLFDIYLFHLVSIHSG